MKANLTFDLAGDTDAIAGAVKAALTGDLQPARDMGAEVKITPEVAGQDHIAVLRTLRDNYAGSPGHTARTSRRALDFAIAVLTGLRASGREG